MREATVWLRPSPHPTVATADFPLIAVGVFEEHGVVARRVIVAILRTFDVLRTGLADDLAQSVDFFFCVRPEGEAVGVAAMARFLVESDEGRCFAFTLGVIADLRWCDADVREAQRAEEDIIEFTGFRKVGHPEVNVIKAVDAHTRKMMFATNTRHQGPQPLARGPHLAMASRHPLVPKPRFGNAPVFWNSVSASSDDGKPRVHS
jgi:hypothetical protein